MVQTVLTDFFVGPPELKTIKPVQGPERARSTGAVAKQAGQHESTEQVGKHAAGGAHAEQRVDRRSYCRRIYHWPVLEELRSNVERRHHDEAGWGGPVAHVDEEV